MNKFENLSNYFFISVPRINGNGGGVGAYIRNDLSFQINFKSCNDLNIYNGIDFLLISLIDQTINMACVYCLPGINHNVCLNTIYLLKSKTPDNLNFIACDDFNINLIDKHVSNNFLDCIHTISLHPIITLLTRVSNHSVTLSDNFL